MASALVYMNGFEFGGDNDQWTESTPNWEYVLNGTFVSTGVSDRGAVTMNSTTETHQPAGKAAPFAGSRSMQLQTINASSFDGAQVESKIRHLGAAGGLGSLLTGRMVFSHWHTANIWTGPISLVGAYFQQRPMLVRFQYDDPIGGSSPAWHWHINWNTNRTLSLYRDNLFQGVSTVQVADEQWTRIGVEWVGSGIGGSAGYLGLRVFVNGVIAIPWVVTVLAGNTFRSCQDQLMVTFFGSTGEKDQPGSVPGNTYVDHLVFTSSDSLSIADGSDVDTGPYSDTCEWQVIIPGIRPNLDIAALTSGSYVPDSGVVNADMIDEDPPDSVDFTISTTPGNFGCSFGALDGTMPGGSTIKGVQLYTMSQGDGTLTTAQLQVVGDAHTGNVLSSAKMIAVTLQSTIKMQTIEQDPNSSSPWAVAGVNLSGFQYTTP